MMDDIIILPATPRLDSNPRCTKLRKIISSQGAIIKTIMMANITKSTNDFGTNVLNSFSKTIICEEN